MVENSVECVSAYLDQKLFIRLELSLVTSKLCLWH